MGALGRDLSSIKRRLKTRGRARPVWRTPDNSTYPEWEAKGKRCSRAESEGPSKLNAEGEGGPQGGVNAGDWRS